MTAKIINGREIAKEIQKKLHKEVKDLHSRYNIIPTLATIIIGKDPSSELYLRLRDNVCKEIGIISNHYRFEENVTEKKIIDTINKLNRDKKTHGIFIQYPTPSHISQYELMKTIDPKKDVEGFNPYNMGRTLLGNESIIPCTPLSVLRILEYEKENIKGKNVVIVNHSNVVGKPLAGLLLNRNATVTICHIFTDDVKKYSLKADILITAVGKPKLITSDFVKENAFLIDVGITETPNGICGDIDFEAVKEKVGKITPVPGGVGPVTIASSMQNTIYTYKNCLEGL
jgi:methylenetetrahydrofolate dehydrogenase (NADP+)/methenyltetrahydrofolate cyclohydrolase